MSPIELPAEHSGILRVATYNIHKGVQGLGPARRLEIHNLGLAVEQLDADIVCLQEVRKMNHKEAAYFKRWPRVPQAEYLAPEGYAAVYRTNAYTRHGEHGNALLTRWPVVGHQHEDISDHRFEQRGLLHVEVEVQGRCVHAIVVHLGLIPGSRVRQVERLQRFIAREVPAGAPLVVANLWDVTDKDLDRFTLAVVEELFLSSASDAAGPDADVLRVVARSRSVCKLPRIVGAAPVCWGGLPIR